MLYPKANIEMILASLIIYDIYCRILKHNNIKVPEMEDIYKNFIQQKGNLNEIS
jgi:ABC-type uncharacterized transport system permease subunit